jgi:hypothetical protein
MKFLYNPAYNEIKNYKSEFSNQPKSQLKKKLMMTKTYRVLLIKIILPYKWLDKLSTA